MIEFVAIGVLVALGVIAVVVSALLKSYANFKDQQVKGEILANLTGYGLPYEKWKETAELRHAASKAIHGHEEAVAEQEAREAAKQSSGEIRRLVPALELGNASSETSWTPPTYKEPVKFEQPAKRRDDPGVKTAGTNQVMLDAGKLFDPTAKS